MQSASLTLSPSSSPLAVAPPTTTSFISSTPPKSYRFASIKANALAVNYNSTISVFPAEACETIGGDACLAGIYQEVKLKPEANHPKISLEPVEREYLDYTEDPRTVLLGEACDVLGGEFCDGPYQMGIC
ncbi:hypothetical protein BUALT_Bualt04G0179900 [Buddleja alternifolia]|uniref:Light-regulated protein n=1 Tax=Buddleja alternifolia TaxID=168488 RepID=A0AAV6XX93_9LAMI|nr:hypothetical protein BUALT_Bualt04G0179900 [Buddleja alternifolia]